MSHDLLHAASLALVLVAPLLGLALLAFERTRGQVMALLPWLALPAVLGALWLPEGGVSSLPAPGGAGLGIDATARAFLFAAGAIWALAGWFARTWFRGPERYVVFLACWLLAMTGNFGLILAQDLLAFYTFFAIMSFAAYGLVIHDGAIARTAGRLYLAMMMLGEVALLAAVSLAASSAGGVPGFGSPHGGALPGVWLFAIGFGIKLGALGVHAWLPRAHAVAPVPASAVLSGVMIKAGALGWWRLVPHEAAEPFWGLLLVGLGVAGALYGVLAGLLRREPKAVLAWSSVSQMGWVVTLAGIGLLEPDARPVVLVAVVLIVLHHGFAKSALFLGVGVLKRCSGRVAWMAWIALCLPALALAGAPLTSGALAKSALETAAQASAPAFGLAPGLAVGSLATTLLMFRLLYLVAPAERGAGVRPPVGLWAPWSGVLVLSAFPALWMGVVLGEMAPPPPVFTLASAWPVAAGIGLGALALVLPRPFARAAKRVGDWRLPGRVPAMTVWMRALLRSEQRLRRWSTVGCVTLGVMVLLMSVFWAAMA